MFVSEKIYLAYEKPEAPEPIDRVVLLKEGFMFWAFLFGPFWLLVKRQWLLFFAFMAIALTVRIGGALVDMPNAAIATLALFLHAMLGFHANDLRAWMLKRKGYRFAGVLAAESAMHAQRRYFEFAA